jgi:hypothetical protein
VNAENPHVSGFAGLDRVLNNTLPRVVFTEFTVERRGFSQVRQLRINTISQNFLTIQHGVSAH